ncbi:hypothetical protein [Synechococcus sp. ROS8604]|nr:hypothetical protein [Synechococcus sp. ROS8604]
MVDPSLLHQLPVSGEGRIRAHGALASLIYLVIFVSSEALRLAHHRQHNN